MGQLDVLSIKFCYSNGDIQEVSIENIVSIEMRSLLIISEPAATFGMYNHVFLVTIGIVLSSELFHTIFSKQDKKSKSARKKKANSISRLIFKLSDASEVEFTVMQNSGLFNNTSIRGLLTDKENILMVLNCLQTNP